MARSTATLLILHVDGTNRWLDSAYSPEYSVVVACPQFGGRDVASFDGNSASAFTGQSYDQGAYPPR